MKEAMTICIRMQPSLAQATRWSYSDCEHSCTLHLEALLQGSENELHHSLPNSEGIVKQLAPTAEQLSQCNVFNPSSVLFTIRTVSQVLLVGVCRRPESSQTAEIRSQVGSPDRALQDPRALPAHRGSRLGIVF
jgi:hypothetical protein